MKKLQHTPGPWLINESDDYTILIRAPWSENVKPEIHDGYGSYLGIHICETRHQGDNPCVSKKTALANARLIAAAPEMLEELINFCRYNCSGCSGMKKGCSGTCGSNVKTLLEKITGLTIKEVLSE